MEAASRLGDARRVTQQKGCLSYREAFRLNQAGWAEQVANLKTYVEP